MAPRSTAIGPRQSFKYRVRLGANGSRVPPLLRRFGYWLATQDYGRVGHFDLEWRRDGNVRTFAMLTKGRRLGLSNDDDPSVVVRDRAGAMRPLARDIGAFLVALSEGSTGVLDLDLSDRAAQGELAIWLRLNNIRARRARRATRRSLSLRPK